MAREIDAVRRATNGIYIGNLEQKRQKLSQLDSEIAELIEKLEDLEQEIDPDPKSYNVQSRDRFAE